MEPGDFAGGHTADARDSLGPWSDANFELTASKLAGPGSDTESSSTTRFVRGVSLAVKRRMAVAQGEDTDNPSVFLLLPNVPDDSTTITHGRANILDDGHWCLAGKIWFVNAPVVSGYYSEHGTVNRDELFTLIVSQQSLGSVATVFYDPKSQAGKLRFYPNGLLEPDIVEPVKFDEPISLQLVLAEIDDAYQLSLITPGLQTPALKLWHNETAVPDAESRVQSVLVERFRRAFPTCTIRFEQSSKAGRDDIEIEEADPVETNRITRHAVLELKVLRETNSSAFVKRHVREGAQQAAAYRDDKAFAAAALCCFDMRRSNSGNACLEHIKSFAKRKAVELRVWFLYASESRWRSAEYAIGS